VINITYPGKKQKTIVTHKYYHEKSTPYHGLAYFYDFILGNSMFPLLRRNFEWLRKRYRIPFNSVADVACGTGSFVRYLTQWNVPVFGIDRSLTMLNIAAQKNANKSVKLFCQDMRQLKLPQPVDLITCNFDSLNYLLTIPDLSKAFHGFYRNLNRDGHLIFDMITSSWKDPGPSQYSRRFIAPGVESHWFISWDPRTKIRSVVINNDISGSRGICRREQEIHKERSYPINQIIRLLRFCDFAVRGVRDASTLMPAGRATTRAVFVVRKLLLNNSGTKRLE